MTRVSLLFATATTAFVALAGCRDNRGSGTLDRPPTLVEVSPENFLGDVACLDAQGAMRRYVATLVDVTADAGFADGFELPSSGPTSCRRRVSFGFVVPGHRYIARIQGFDVTDLRPLGTGSSVMVSGNGETAPPRWTTTCGIETRDGGTTMTDAGTDAGDGGTTTTDSDTDAGTDAGDGGFPTEVVEPAVKAAQSVQFRTVPILGCAPLQEHFGSTTPTAIEIRLANALGNLSCGADLGQVAAFDAAIVGGPLALPKACDEPLVIETAATGRLVEVDVRAFETGQTSPRWATTCFATAVDGVRVRASCDPLTEIDADAGIAGAADAAGSDAP